MHRAYTGEFIRDDPQEKLALPDPTLPTGEILPGFMGYAVNMINIDAHHLKNTRTAANHGLRETLFYSLFGEVQVYETRKHMEVARAYINHGAVSLDGGILKPNGFVSLGVRYATHFLVLHSKRTLAFTHGHLHDIYRI